MNPDDRAGGTPPAVRLSGISKRFGAVQANRDVDLEVARGSIHGIIGENGAGKSTLVSILYGFYEADAGRIEIDGHVVAIRSSAAAIAQGIGMVHQHFMLVPTFTVLENVMLGAEGGPLLARGAAETRAELLDLSTAYGLEVDPDAKVGDLAVGLQQRVEILKALRRGARILILDEPTGVLTPDETGRLFDILRGLRREGVTILLITHKLREIMAVTDRVSVMRQGEMVAHRETASTTPEELAELMVGRRVAAMPRRELVAALGVDAGGGGTPRARSRPQPNAGALEVRGLGWRDARGITRLSDVSLTLREGEILGLAGVAGNGQSELLDVLSGIATPQSGVIRIGERIINRDRPAGPAELRALGLAHVPEDRHRRGVVLGFTAQENAVLGYQHGPAAGDGRLLSPAALACHCAALMKRFDVRPAAPGLRMSGFSGGNQQKLVLAREIEAEPRILLVGQPTRGVDIGAIEFIHGEILKLRDQGCAILLVSVELDEILALADRVAVMNAGRIVGERRLSGIDAEDRSEIGLMMAGIARIREPAAARPAASPEAGSAEA
ncbi:ABC transporter ATP-binding protein [Limibaculum sp. M0105]|uniref:ABC transporter ATP-binding protein n=1 Tax=Thermohalobaculum xanthum TaxID=2753746 RepID=A0A8J7M810_9RHOB|nr:ABC transporter ATP-binding protein [Thermohalobaculum xanthum]MBK0400271.1 ABC transporter ATP-binding protein [Thermohalobaculum xanthum]